MNKTGSYRSVTTLLLCAVAVSFCIATAHADEWLKSYRRLGETPYSKLTTDMDPSIFQQLLRKAKHGDPLATDAVFLCYRFGLGTTADQIKRFQWQRRSVRRGGPFAKFASAKQMDRADEGSDNDRKAKKWYKNVISKLKPLVSEGDLWAITYVGRCHYRLGRKKKAFRLLKKAVRKGFPRGDAILSTWYFEQERTFFRGSSEKMDPETVSGRYLRCHREPQFPDQIQPVHLPGPNRLGPDPQTDVPENVLRGPQRGFPRPGLYPHGKRETNEKVPFFCVR